MAIRQGHQKQAITIDECIKALEHHGAVIVTFECFESAKTAERGYIAPPKEGERKLGLHAVALYDHSPEEECFYFRNSWGEHWGEKGYGALSYEFIENGHLTNLIVLG